jgi:hypothetical protein
MDYLNVLSLFVGMLGTVGVAESIISLRRKINAEKKYIDYLRTEKVSRNLRVRINSFNNEGVVSDEDLTVIINRLDKAARRLSRRDRMYIAEALHQRSTIGRARYADKVLEKAGIFADSSSHVSAS